MSSLISLFSPFNGSTNFWIKLLGGTISDTGTGIAVDSSGNVYVTGYTGSQGAGGNDILIAKYNTSGVIQWQRTFGGASSDVGTDIAVDSSGNVYVTGYTGSQGAGGTYNVLIAKLPSNGSLAGTYGNFIYQASTLTDTASALTDTTSTLTDTTSALTTVPSALTAATSTLTETVIL